MMKIVEVVKSNNKEENADRNDNIDFRTNF